MTCIICGKGSFNEKSLYTHLAMEHLQRSHEKRPGYTSEGLCFCGEWTARLFEHCESTHRNMTIEDIANAIALGINPSQNA